MLGVGLANIQRLKFEISDKFTSKMMHIDAKYLKINKCNLEIE